MADNGDYVRSHYGVPAELDGRITYEHEHRDGTITGFDGPHILVRLDGDQDAVPMHPTWSVTYHEAVAS